MSSVGLGVHYLIETDTENRLLLLNYQQENPILLHRIAISVFIDEMRLLAYSQTNNKQRGNWT